MTGPGVGMIACDPGSHDHLAAEGRSPLVLGPIDSHHRPLGPLDDLTVARWLGADHVFATGEAGSPTSHPSVRTYLQEHGISLGPQLGGELWQVPAPPEPGGPKVFCLGLTKTGTSTLAEALEMLGVRCFHWGGPAAYHAVLDALRAGELLTAGLPGGCDGYADVGTLVERFRLVDLQHPGSRFILTVRDEDAWIDSRRRHVERNRRDRAIGRYRGNNLEVDEAAWRASWHAHLTSVREYFAGREDLLELDLTSSPGWEELASFLGTEAPEVAFPAANIDGRPSPARYPTFRRGPSSSPGHRHAPRAECPICGTVAERFESSGSAASCPDCRCPNCGSLERDRAMWIFLVDRTDVLDRPRRVLLVNTDPIFRRMTQMHGFHAERASPVLPMRHRLRQIARRRIIRGSRTDLAAIDVADDTYDLVVLSHVLQLVADDRRVLDDLQRVTAPGGGVLVSVPTFGPAINDRGAGAKAKALTRRLSGSASIRSYGNDGALEARLEDAGFTVVLEDVPSCMGSDERERFRLGSPEVLRWATRG